MTGEVVGILVTLIAVAGVTTSIVAYFRLQQHRADAQALTAYREFAAQAVADQRELRAEVAEVHQRLKSVEELLRSVG